MITHSVYLPRTQVEAFQLFTERVSEWWPESHRPSKDPSSVIVIEPHGRFREQTSDGREFDLGFVRHWMPPTHLVLDFYLGPGPEQPTEVTVQFHAEGDGTRVLVEHRPTARSAELWDARAPRYAASWPAVLAALSRIP